MSEDTVSTPSETSASTTAEVADVEAAEPQDETAAPAAEGGAAADASATAEESPVAAGEAAEASPETLEEADGADAPAEPAVEADGAEASPEAPEAAPAKPKPEKAKPEKAPAPDPIPESGPVAELHQAMLDNRSVKGKVIGWNNGGFHVLTNEVTAFCPRSEMEVGKPKAPAGYLDKEYEFRVLEIQKSGRRVVVSRAAEVKKERTRRKAAIRGKVEAGKVLTGRIASLTDFGAFVDLGGVQGLVHVSEIRRERVNDPRDLLQAGQEVTVKVLKVEQGGRRISLSMKALEPDPWDGVAQRFEEGAVVNGTVEKTASFGAFVALEPGLTGLLPASGLSLPRGASLARQFPRGKQLSVQILRVDPKRRRISLALEGSKMEGSRSDYEKYVKGQSGGGSEGFNALAAAFDKLQRKSD